MRIKNPVHDLKLLVAIVRMKKISLKKVSDEVAIIQVKISDTTIWVKAGKLYGRSEFAALEIHSQFKNIVLQYAKIYFDLKLMKESENIIYTVT